MKVVYVKSAKGKPLSLSGPGDVEVTIKQVMIDNDIPCEVKDCDFIRGCMTKKNMLLVQDTSEEGKKKWKAYISEKQKADSERQKKIIADRVEKLKARRKREERGSVKIEKPVKPKVKQEANE